MKRFLHFFCPRNACHRNADNAGDSVSSKPPWKGAYSFLLPLTPLQSFDQGGSFHALDSTPRVGTILRPQRRSPPIGRCQSFHVGSAIDIPDNLLVFVG